MKNYGYEIAEIKAQEFNEQNSGYEITVNGKSSSDELAVDAVFATDGDRHLNTYNLFRAKCLDLNKMPTDTINWMKKWESWKMSNNYVDFTDMISITATLKDPFPGNPKVGIYDEVQDFNKLELNLIRHWSQFQDHIILAGDDDQCIFDFVGSSPDAFISSFIDQDHKRFLRKSWRLPKKIHEFSQKWIKQVKKREPKEFDPRAEEGSLVFLDSHYKSPEAVIELAERTAQSGKTVMILATCGYMLIPVKNMLRENSLPFHNPYRVTRGDWNPMGSFHRSQGNRISTRERILSFLDEVMGMPNDGYWNAFNLQRWTDMIKTTGVMKRGAKDIIANIIEDKKGYIINEETFYASIFEDFALKKALLRDIDWFKEVLLKEKRAVVEYPLAVMEKYGRKTLNERPKITLGTIHSVKGGEADTVILFPDLSLAAMTQYEKDRDSIIRTFYVGMTRARESLVICQPQSMMNVDIRE